MRLRCQTTIALASAAAVLLLYAASPVFAQDKKGPIKVGFLAPYVGVFAQIGKDMDAGFHLGLEEAGYRAGGRQLAVVTEDSEARPELGPTKARKLIESDKVDVIVGLAHSGVALSIRDIVTNAKVPTIITNAGEPALTGKLKSPYIFRVSFANGQVDLAGGWYAYHKLGFRRMMIVAPDYSAGHDKAEGFMKYFKAAGGQIVEEVYAPLNTQDFGPYLSKVEARAKSIDGVWLFFSGSGCIRLINQYAEYGLKDRVPLFVIGDAVDDAFLPSMKDNALGVKNYVQYAETLNTPENLKFVKAYRARYKDYPSMFAEEGYLGAKVLVMALNAVKGNIENKDAFLAALRNVKFTAPRGPFAFDSNQNVVLTTYIGQVQKVDGRYATVVFDSIPNVDQDWSPAKMGKN